MSVALTRNCFDSREGDPCNNCGGKVFAPYMVWRGETDIIFCSECAEHIRDGFCADLVHLAAVHQLRRFQPNFGITLERARVGDLEAKEKEKQKSFISLVRT
jgi:hypothetical protein